MWEKVSGAGRTTARGAAAGARKVGSGAETGAKSVGSAAGSGAKSAGSLVAAAVPYVRAAAKDPEIQDALRDMLSAGRQLGTLRGEGGKGAARKLGNDAKLQGALGKTIGAAGLAGARLTEVRPKKRKRRILVVAIFAATFGALGAVAYKLTRGRDDGSDGAPYAGADVTRPAGAPAATDDAIRPAGS
jgi:hypothetical protein